MKKTPEIQDAEFTDFDPSIDEPLVQREIDTHKHKQDTKASKPQQPAADDEFAGMEEDDTFTYDDGIKEAVIPDYEDDGGFATPDAQENAQAKVIKDSLGDTLVIANLFIPEICGYFSKIDVQKIENIEVKVNSLLKKTNFESAYKGISEECQQKNNRSLEKYRQITKEGLASIEGPLNRILQREKHEIRPEWQIVLGGTYMVAKLGMAVIETRKSNQELVNSFVQETDRIIEKQNEILRKMQENADKK